MEILFFFVQTTFSESNKNLPGECNSMERFSERNVKGFLLENDLYLRLKIFIYGGVFFSSKNTAYDRFGVSVT